MVCNVIYSMVVVLEEVLEVDNWGIYELMWYQHILHFLELFLLVNSIGMRVIVEDVQAHYDKLWSPYNPLQYKEFPLVGVAFLGSVGHYDKG